MLLALDARVSLDSQATHVQRKGKPVFQLKGAVYYRLAPTMVPPAKYDASYAQLYTLDPDDGLNERLKQMLKGTSLITRATSPCPPCSTVLRPTVSHFLSLSQIAVLPKTATTMTMTTKSACHEHSVASLLHRRERVV